jgi:signal transduction histidine kinase
MFSLRSQAQNTRNSTAESLAGRLVLATFGFCVLFALIVISLRAWSAWQTNVAAMKSDLALIIQVYQHPLGKAIWDFDHEIIKSYLDSAARAEVVGQVTIKVTPAGRAPETFQRTRPSWRDSTLAPVRHVPLVYVPYLGAPDVILGELSLYGDEKVLWARLRDEVVSIAFTQAIQFLLLASLISLLFNRTVTIHVQHIASHLKHLTIDRLDQSLKLNRQRLREDELTLLTNGINQLQKNLLDYLQQQQRDERELARHRDNLAELVAERTAELSASNNNLESTLRDLRATQAQLIQSEKMASLGQLVANVAHEINTPIAVVKSSGKSISESLLALDEDAASFGNLELEIRLLFGKLVAHAHSQQTIMSSREERIITKEVTQQLEAVGIEDARQKAGVFVQLNAQNALLDYLPLLRHAKCALILNRANNTANIIGGTSRINRAVDNVARIVFALKTFSRIDSTAEMVEAQLCDGLDVVLTLYQNQIKRGTTLVKNYEVMPVLHCLPDELNQVWTNLIHNALQAMPHSGTLTIGIASRGNEAVVSIGDTGSGIPDDIRERIFDPFFTTKPIGEGSGLGLDISKKIVEKHKGRIELRTELNVGTTFFVYLPYDPRNGS